METDLVIGFIKNYNPFHVHNWVTSLKETGYFGDIMLVDYTPNEEMSDYCQDKGVRYLEHRDTPSPSRNVCVDRFLDLHRILADSSLLAQKYRYVITTDVRDVIFQKNPIDFFNNELDLDFFYENGRDVIINSSEGVAYKDEPWSYNNMKLSFGGDTLAFMKDYPIINAGVLAGTHSTISAISLAIYQMCVGRPAYVPGGGGPDQSALNVLKRTTSPYSSIILDHDNCWAAQIGTMLDPTKDFSKVRIDNGIDFDGNGTVRNVYGEAFYIVHQYDRNPELKKLIDERYKI